MKPVLESHVEDIEKFRVVLRSFQKEAHSERINFQSHVDDTNQAIQRRLEEKVDATEKSLRESIEQTN